MSKHLRETAQIAIQFIPMENPRFIKNHEVILANLHMPVQATSWP